jgi:three-Cys-motif partner protein
LTKLADHDLRKWVYTAHTGAKHEIVDRYLATWLRILGAVHGGRTYPRLIIFDGFAGRARYRDGELGSTG